MEGGAIERLPLVPAGLKGRVRAQFEAAALVGLPRPDAIWTSVGEVLAPYLWLEPSWLRWPPVLDLD